VVRRGSNATGMERDLSVGTVFSAAFSAFAARARVLVPIVFFSSLVVSAISRLLGPEGIGFLVGWVVDAAFFALVQAVAMTVLRDLRERRPASSIGDLLATALPPLPAATLVGVLALAAVTVALVFLIVPGLYLMTIWAVVLPVAVVERPGVFDAFGRSRGLVRGNGWKVLGVVLLLGLLLAVSAALALLLHRHAAGPVVSILFGSLLSSVIAPIQMLVLGVLYFRLLDIERERPAESVLEQPGDSAS